MVCMILGVSIYFGVQTFVFVCKLLRTQLQWRHNERYGVSIHQPHDCLLNCLFRHKPKKTSKLRVTGRCEGISPATGEFPTQRASKTLKVQTVIFGCTPDSGGTAGFWWCICRILVVHLWRNGWRSGCTTQKHRHRGACCVGNEVTKMCIW